MAMPAHSTSDLLTAEELAPDLAAEIVSLDDRPGELLAKVGQWLDAGTKLVWIIDPVGI